jgi:formiminotetrahydrofolate cyclodeaminase
LNATDFAKLPCEAFTELLASKSAVPGGGGTSALVGALGVSLGLMVANLTLGKRKYVEVEADIRRLSEEAEGLRLRLLDLIAEDARVFEPLSKAYGLPAETESEKAHKAEILEAALNEACTAPLSVMRACCEAIKLHEAFAEKGAAGAISDVGVGVLCCKAALQGASLNVFINTKPMKNAERAARTNAAAEDMLRTHLPFADRVYERVRSGFALG